MNLHLWYKPGWLPNWIMHYFSFVWQIYRWLQSNQHPKHMFLQAAQQNLMHILINKNMKKERIFFSTELRLWQSSFTTDCISPAWSGHWKPTAINKINHTRIGLRRLLLVHNAFKIKCTNTQMHECVEEHISLHTQCYAEMCTYTLSRLMSPGSGAEASWHGDLFICFEQ